MGMENRNTTWKKRNGNNEPNRDWRSIQNHRKKITQNTISKKKRTGRNGKKISFTPEWAHRNQEENNTGKYITVAIEEEDKTIIGFMREHDTDPRPEIQITKISPRGFPIKTGKEIKAHRASIRNVAKWKGGIMGITEYNYPNPKEWTLGNTPGRKQLDKITVKDITIPLKEHQEPR